MKFQNIAILIDICLFVNKKHINLIINIQQQTQQFLYCNGQPTMIGANNIYNQYQPPNFQDQPPIHRPVQRPHGIQSPLLHRNNHMLATNDGSLGQNLQSVQDCEQMGNNKS